MLALLLVIVSSQLFAQPVITSVTPPSSPVSGQTEVTIRGSNFSNICPPGFPCTTREPQAFFGGTSALSTRLVDANTIIAVAPPHLPGASFITVSQPNGASSIRFSYEGDPSEAFDPILVPLLTPPVNGAFGSRFVPEFQILNTGTRQVQAYGLKTFFCTGFVSLPVPADPREDPLILTPRSEPQCVDRTRNPGRLVWVPKGTSDLIAANLRVFDTSQQSTSFGTEIPIARQRDFRSGTIALLGVPLSERFRVMLRIYGLEPESMAVNVTLFNGTTAVQLRPGNDLFDPAYGAFSEFPYPVPGLSVLASSTNVFIEPAPEDVSRHIWAFITVTNNETQQITTIAPH